MTPSLNRLEREFPGKGAEIRLLLTGTVRPTHYASVRKWVDACLYHKPTRIERQLCALNEILEGHGVEAIFHDSTHPDMEYINRGDTYITTIIRDHLTGTWKIQSWGDWVETAERRGRRYD